MCDELHGTFVEGCNDERIRLDEEVNHLLIDWIPLGSQVLSAIAAYSEVIFDEQEDWKREELNYGYVELLVDVEDDPSDDEDQDAGLVEQDVGG